MATLRITFTPVSPAPANGYLVAYRRAGTADPYTTITVNNSPADINVLDGWSYEGTIRSDCGGGVFSPVVEFEANVVADPCYIYEFSNVGASNATVYYKDCGDENVSSIVVNAGGPQVYQCMETDYIIINSTQIPPGTASGTIDNVTWARTTDPSCVPVF